MMNLIRSELLKLRTIRLNIVLMVVAIGFVVVIIAIVGTFWPSDELLADGPTSGDIAEVIGVSGVLAGLLVSVVSVLSVSAEFGHGTIRPTLVATPNRLKVFGAKALVLCVLAAIIGAATGLVSYLIGYGLLSARGAEDLKLFDSDGTVAVLIGMPIFFVLLSMFGFGLGLLIRNSPAAVAIAILWPIVIENVIALSVGIAGVDDPTTVLPYLGSVALVTPEADFANGRVGGALYFGAVVTVLVGVATFVNTRRDV
jgi:ABC-2 type transport system permease protein